MPTTGLGVLHVSTMLKYKTIACDHFSESFSGMSMNDAQYTEMGIRIFIYGQNYLTILNNYLQPYGSYDHTIMFLR